MTRPATMKVTYTPISEQLKLISSCPWTPTEPCAEERSSLCKGMHMLDAVYITSSYILHMHSLQHLCKLVGHSLIPRKAQECGYVYMQLSIGQASNNYCGTITLEHMLEHD